MPNPKGRTGEPGNSSKYHPVDIQTSRPDLLQPANRRLKDYDITYAIKGRSVQQKVVGEVKSYQHNSPQGRSLEPGSRGEVKPIFISNCPSGINLAGGRTPPQRQGPQRQQKQFNYLKSQNTGKKQTR